jgi:hypothetical protein
VLKSNVDFMSCSCTNTIHMSSMFFGCRFKLGISKRRKRSVSSSREDSPHDESYVPSQSKATYSYASGSHDIDMEDVDVEFDPQAYNSPIKRWTEDSYQKAHTVCAYEREEDSPTPQFQTKVQHGAFYGHLVKKSMFSQKSIDWNYLEKYAPTRPLMEKFQHIGLLKFTQLTCDWNETAIRKIYPTVDIDWEDEMITWITSSRKFTATFAEFGSACQINYERTKNGEYVLDLDAISVDTRRSFYKPNQYNGHRYVNGLRVMSAVINKMVRFTLYPKSGNSNIICDQHWNLVDFIMRRQRINAMRFMLNYIEMIGSSIQYNLYYAPFIMSLILSKTSFPIRPCLMKQHSYQPFGATKQVLLANDEGDEALHEHDDAPPQPQSQGPPPMNLINPLMPRFMNVIQQSMQAGMVNFHSSYNEQYHRSIMQHFDTLNANLGTIQSDVDSLTN